MSNACEPQIQAVRMRVSRLDGAGVPDPGPTNMYVTDAFVNITVTPVYLDGLDTNVPNAGGVTCIDYKGPDTLRRAEISIELCTPDPYLMEMLSNGTLLDDSGDIGWAAPPVGQISQRAVSIEAWAKRIDDGDLDPFRPYAWWVYPKALNLRLSPHTHMNGPLQPTFTGHLVENENWWDGPTNDWPVASDRLYQWFPTSTLPAAGCGPMALAAS